MAPGACDGSYSPRGGSRQSTQRRAQSDSAESRLKREFITAWVAGLEVFPVGCPGAVSMCDTSSNADHPSGSDRTQGGAVDGVIAIFSARGPRGE